ncbi:hypothetical protein LOC68_17430 [Blastopirellula sp. JC732]|uniref:Leucine Rich repeats (2 copies) n=1 Tax=Blastopirellula sediminis TaxID=2894196 RepID=A0A9X1SKW8_9BACT|nr:hypothetical protein [Blastopirellula sediminis]MCC9606523.1 hypothetical protein [Blastopirellula sediminis]MCC9630179.1 hypothetical protein [Blastopirellula sediminis]
MKSEESPLPTMTTPPPRRRLRFSLRTLLIATPILAVLFAWIGAEKMRHDKDQAAAEHLRSRFSTTWSRDDGRWNLFPPNFSELGRGRLYLPSTRLLIRSPGTPSKFNLEDWQAAGELLKLEELTLYDYQGPQTGSTFENLHMLESLELESCQLTSNDLRQINAWPHLKRFRFHHDAQFNQLLFDREVKKNVTPVFPQLEVALDSWPQMEKLDIACMDVTADALQGISKLKSLRELRVTFSDFDVAGLNYLERSPNLTELTVWGHRLRSVNGQPVDSPAVDATTLEHWGRRHTLEMLDISASPPLASFGGVGSDLSQRWPSLSKLRIGHTDLSPLAVQEIAAIPHLTSLAITACTTDGASLSALGDAKNLTYLCLDCDGPDAAAMAKIAQLPQLRSLTLSGKEIDDQMMLQIAAMDQLTRLELYHTQVSDQGIALLEQHPSLANLWVFNSPITNRSLASVARIPSLSFSRCKLTGPGVNQDFLERLTKLEENSGDVTAYLKEKGLYPVAPLPETSSP